MNDQSVNELWSLIKDGMKGTILENTKSDLKLLPALALSTIDSGSDAGKIRCVLNGADATDVNQVMVLPNMTGVNIEDNSSIWVAYMYSLDNAYVMYTADQFTNGMPEWAIASELAQSITTEELTVDGHNMLNSLVYKGTLTSSDDLNNITESGIYYINDPMPSNCPTGATYSKLFVTGKNNVPTQIIFRADASSGRMWIRIYGGNPLTWRAWRTFTDIDSTNALIYRGTLTSADDLDNINTSGIYWVDGEIPINAPIGASTYCYVLSICRASSPMQIYLNTSADTQNFISMRRKVGATPTWKEWFTVKDVPFGRGTTIIPTNANLNNYTTAGVYYCANSATSQSLSNSPYTQGIWTGSTGFRMEVIITTGTGYGVQKIITHNPNTMVFYRTLNNGTFNSWHHEMLSNYPAYPENLTTGSGGILSLASNVTLTNNDIYRTGYVVNINARIQTSAQISGGGTLISGFPQAAGAHSYQLQFYAVNYAASSTPCRLFFNGSTGILGTVSALASGADLRVTFTYICK